MNSYIQISTHWFVYKNQFFYTISDFLNTNHTNSYVPINHIILWPNDVWRNVMQTAQQADHGYAFWRGGDFQKKVTITRVYEINTPSLLSLDKIEPNCAIMVVNEKEAYYIV